MAAYKAKFRVWRGDDDGGALEDFSVDVNEGEVVLDIVHRLQATDAPDLAVRWNCKAGKCGSCSAEVNGRPRLMCMTRMSTFTEDETITLTPLRGFPVTRDLVTDVEYNKLAFAGPRYFIRAAELDMHPLDDRDDRREFSQAEQGIGLCNITKCCTEVCPEGIKITDNAIIPMKERVVDRKYDPLVWLGNKILRRGAKA